MWCPELAKVPNEYIHDPWNMPKALQKTLGVQIGGEKPAGANKDDDSISFYPAPIACTKYTSPEAAKKVKRTSKPSTAPRYMTLGTFMAKGKKK